MYDPQQDYVRIVYSDGNERIEKKFSQIELYQLIFKPKQRGIAHSFNFEHSTNVFINIEKYIKLLKSMTVQDSTLVFSFSDYLNISRFGTKKVSTFRYKVKFDSDTVEGRTAAAIMIQRIYKKKKGHAARFKDMSKSQRTELVESRRKEQ